MEPIHSFSASSMKMEDAATRPTEQSITAGMTSRCLSLALINVSFPAIPVKVM